MLDLSEFMPAYRAEAGGLLDALEADLLALEAQPDAQPGAQPDRGAALQRAFRAAHSLKGGAAMLELHDLQALTHSLENLLDAARRTPPAAANSATIWAAMLEAVDLLRALLERARPGERGDPQVAAMLLALDRAVAGLATPDLAAPDPDVVPDLAAPGLSAAPGTDPEPRRPESSGPESSRPELQDAPLAPAPAAGPSPAAQPPLALLCEPAELAARVLRSQLEALGYAVERRAPEALLPLPAGTRLVLVSGRALSPALQAALRAAEGEGGSVQPGPVQPNAVQLCAVSEDEATRARLTALGIPAHPRPARGHPADALPRTWRPPAWQP